MKQLGLAHDTTPTIEEVLSVWAGQGKPQWMTRKEIAEALGRSKSPSLVVILGIAAGTGLLQQKLVTLPNKIDMFMYRPTPRG